MKSSSSLSDVCTSFISIVKAKLFWKIFLSGGEFTEKENVWGKDVNEKNRVVIPDKNLEADNCHWIEQELRRLQTWEEFLIKSCPHLVGSLLLRDDCNLGEDPGTVLEKYLAKALFHKQLSS